MAAAVPALPWPPPPRCSQLSMRAGKGRRGEGREERRARQSDTEQGNDHGEMGTRLPEHRDVIVLGTSPSPARSLDVGSSRDKDPCFIHQLAHGWRAVEEGGGLGLDPKGFPAVEGTKQIRSLYL